MGQTIYRNLKYLERIHEVLFSAYFSLLFLWAEESRPFPWSVQGRYIRFWHPHAVSLGLIDFLLFYLALFLIPAAGMFVCLLVIKRLSLTHVLLRPVGGLLAIAGLPLVNFSLSRRYPTLVPLAVALMLPAICFVLWAYRKWPVSNPVTVFLLVMYYVVCSLFGGGPDSVNWRWAEGIWEYLWFVYPTAGLCYTLVWAAYFKQSESDKAGWPGL